MTQVCELLIREWFVPQAEYATHLDQRVKQLKTDTITVYRPSRNQNEL